MEINEEVLAAILDAYAYEIVFADRNHIVRYMNAVAKRRYTGRVNIGASLFNCHNENSRIKIEAFLKRADEVRGSGSAGVAPAGAERRFAQINPGAVSPHAPSERPPLGQGFFSYASSRTKASMARTLAS